MRFHWLLPTIKGIPVLMYHRVWPGLQDGLTVTPEQLAEQWNYLKNEGYEAISLTQFLSIAEGSQLRKGKQLLLTFDDGYRNNLTYVYPLLQQLGWKATFFIIGETLEEEHNIDEPFNRKLNIDELRLMDTEVVQLGMHGYHHENFKETSLSDIKAAILASIEVFERNGVRLNRSVAYPFGARPKDPIVFTELKKWMKQQDIKAAFRIGNQVSKIPVPDIYEIKRIDIRGTDTMEDFKIKFRKGKLNPF